MDSLATRAEGLLQAFEERGSLRLADMATCWRELRFGEVHHIAEACGPRSRKAAQILASRRGIQLALYSALARRLVVPGSLAMRIGALYALWCAYSTQTLFPPEKVPMAPNVLEAALDACSCAREHAWVGHSTPDFDLVLAKMVHGQVLVFQLTEAWAEELAELRSQFQLDGDEPSWPMPALPAVDNYVALVQHQYDQLVELDVDELETFRRCSSLRAQLAHEGRAYLRLHLAEDGPPCPNHKDFTPLSNAQACPPWRTSRRGQRQLIPRAGDKAFEAALTHTAPPRAPVVQDESSDDDEDHDAGEEGHSDGDNNSNASASNDDDDDDDDASGSSRSSSDQSIAVEAFLSDLRRRSRLLGQQGGN